jgi:hypothetical protein
VYPTPIGNGMHEGGHGTTPSAGMPGMMTYQDMAALAQASGGEFDKMQNLLKGR